jgi:chromosome segregation ATPase
MSLEWEKIESKPDKAYKVEGQFLLDQRAKIAELEANLHETRTDLEDVKKSFNTANLKIQEMDADLQEATSVRSQLEITLQEKDTLEKEYNEMKASVDNFMNKVQSTEGELDRRSSDLEVAHEQIKYLNEKADEIRGLSEKSAGYLKQIDDLNAELTGKNSTLDNLKARLDQIEPQLGEARAKVNELQARVSEKDLSMEELEGKLKDFESPVPEISDIGDERIVCPMCGDVHTRQVEDKTKVLSYVGHIPIYAKKNQCRKCGYEF